VIVAVEQNASVRVEAKLAEFVKISGGLICQNFPPFLKACRCNNLTENKEIIKKK